MLLILLNHIKLLLVLSYLLLWYLKKSYYITEITIFQTSESNMCMCV